MLTQRDFAGGFRKLGIDPAFPVIVHAMLPAFGDIRGGGESVLEALLSSFDTVITPVFTCRTMVIPEVGPPNNGLVYGSGKDSNGQAEMFHPEMPADKKMGELAEALRKHPRAYRSTHPMLSFAGINARSSLEKQQTHDPLQPIQHLIDEEGWVLLVGTNHTANTSIHYAEKLSGRRQFIRWALTEKGVISCWGFPGCPDGFEAVAPYLEGLTRNQRLGEGFIQAIPLVYLVDAVCGMLRADPLALLCEREDCPRCSAIRASVTQAQTHPKAEIEK